MRVSKKITKLSILSLVLTSSITWATIPEGDTSGSIDGLAIGQDSVSENMESVAVGIRSKAKGWEAVSIGIDSEALENRAVAIGGSSKALKKYAISLGDSSRAEEVNTIALGSGAMSFKEGAISLGTRAIAEGVKSLAIGYSSRTEADDSQALGYGARTIHNKSVALGYGAVSLEENTISVAYKNPDIAIANQPEKPFYRKIVGLADGVNDHDAVNVSQLKGLENSLISKFNAFSMTEVKANAGISSAMAMAALPQPTGKGISLGASVGMYMGQTSYALGVSGTEGNVRYNINTSLTSKANVGFSAGIGYTFKEKEEIKETNEVKLLKSEINNLNETIKQLLNRIEKLEQK